jgi:sec-independent protein translocase protein TatC
VWAFIVPGLHPKEKKYALPFVFISVFLFLIGAVFAYVTLPSALNFLVSLGGDNLIPFFSAADYLGFIGLIILVFGVTFEAPLLLFFLGLVGVVSVEQLRGWRRAAIVGIAIVSAVVTPSQDPYTMLAMAVPLYLFYELAILALSVVAKRRAKRAGTA